MSLLAPFTDRRSYQTLLHLLLAPLVATIGVAIMLAGWLASGLLSVTPLVGPALVAFRYALGATATTEAGLARSLLGAGARPSLVSGGRGLYGQGKAVLFDSAFWKQQAYQLSWCLLGGTVMIAVVSLLGASLEAIAQPVLYHWSVQDFGAWRVDRLSRTLPFVPAGIVVLVATMHLLRPLRAASSATTTLLDDRSERASLAPAVSPAALGIHAAAIAGIDLLLIVSGHSPGMAPSGPSGR